MKKSITGNTITFTFDGAEPVVFDAGKTSEAVMAYAMMHGFAARIGDNAAIARKQADGTVITVTEAMRREAVLELVNHYESGSEVWDTRLAKTRKDTKNAFMLKVAAARNCTYEEAERYIAEKYAAELIAL